MDEPESQLPALYQTATGAGDGIYISPDQQANFRSAATKLILLWTDATFHRTYSVPGASPATYIQAVIAIDALDYSKVLGISSGPNSLPDLADVADDTNALAPASGVDCNNDKVIDIYPEAPLVCSVGSQGEGISDAVLSLVEAATECKIFRVFLPLVNND
jgi:hypothetical protein